MDDIQACLAFFSRLPVRGPHTERPFSDSLWAAPVAGAVIGLLVGLIMLLALRLGIPAGASAAIALAAGMVATGALHEDGAGDVADGFGGGRTREDKLAIMHDSRVGTYGVLALCLSVLVRWTALTAIATADAGAILAVTIAAHAASRALLPAFAATTPAARSDGLSSGLGPIDRNVWMIALVLGFVALLLQGSGYALAALVVLGLVFYALKWLCQRQIGGQTGDVLGALQQVGEAALFTLAATMG